MADHINDTRFVVDETEQPGLVLQDVTPYQIRTSQVAWLTFCQSGGETICTISQDLKVTLNPKVVVKDLSGIPLEYLLLLKEVVNTAIYDKKKEPWPSNR